MQFSFLLPFSSSHHHHHQDIHQHIQFYHHFFIPALYTRSFLLTFHTMPGPINEWVYAAAAIGLTTGVTSAVCSLIHLSRSVHRDRRVEEEQRIVGLDQALRAGKSNDDALFKSRLTQVDHRKQLVPRGRHHYKATVSITLPFMPCQNVVAITT